MSLDLNKLADKLDKALNNETTESLTDWLGEKTMSNNKQSMKLYTEEEIVSFLKKEFADEIDAETFMENLTPIELPSDEEIKKEMGYDEFDPYDVAYFGGISYMRDKIQGGNL